MVSFTFLLWRILTTWLVLQVACHTFFIIRLYSFHAALTFYMQEKHRYHWQPYQRWRQVIWVSWVLKLISDLRMFLLIPLLLFVHGAHCGHFLFWLPMRFDNIKHLNFFKFVRFFMFSAKSVKIAAIEPGLALAEKGHQVTIVCPIKAKKEVGTFPELAQNHFYISRKEECMKLSTLPISTCSKMPFRRSSWLRRQRCRFSLS